MSEPRAPQHWWLADDVVLTLGAGALLVLVGVLAGRPEVALVAAPLVLVGARGVLRHDPDADLPQVQVRPAGVAEPGRAAATVELSLPERAGWLRVRLSRAGHDDRELLLAARPAFDVTTHSVRTGPQELLGVDVQAIGLGGLTGSEAVRVPAAMVVVRPRTRRVDAVPVPPTLRGHTGQHASRRPGDGGDFRDLHPFMPGDTLRRVDWKVTARLSPDVDALWVRRTFALAEAHVVILVDSRDDVGPDPTTWSGSGQVRPDDQTSLDLARAAALSLTRAYVAAGDRVGVEDLASLRHPMRPAAGRRHVERVGRWLSTVRPYGAPRALVRPPRVPAGALVVVVSTFLDGEAADLAALWSRAGHRVVAVDVLPPLRRVHLSARERLALRLVDVERSDRLAGLAAAGVELVGWGAGRADADLRRLTTRRWRR
ncbi:DUF58 domain-containing protein [Actinotalea sp. M2MS4P-6]|uniref:DUF58 domain-containing protein n=1 Tax=Actinotalea sp. M2MS4P-6 TaxID=2983762 RepID=UPI0021E390E6|nr:DUF58 domain-containing protein [Actinotalea sp. M2MS4P-6]MCV2392915.1 DUF58 domain-containing protein [Actinotalea sp. M2MS4P-6]